MDVGTGGAAGTEGLKAPTTVIKELLFEGELEQLLTLAGKRPCLDPEGKKSMTEADRKV